MKTNKTISKILLIITVFITMLVLQICFSNTSNAYSAHTADQAIEWVKSKLGTGVGTGECVALINAYYQYLGVSPVSGDGGDYIVNNLPSGWQRLQGVQPQKGDILVYKKTTSNPHGHVAIYEADYSHYHQNLIVNGQNHRYVERVTTWRYDGTTDRSYWGVIRPDFNSDNIAPTISEAFVDIPSMTATSYVIKAKVSDNVELKEVTFPTNTVQSGDEVLVWYPSTYNSSTGYYECKVETKNHRNETGIYRTHITATDTAGNVTRVQFNNIPVGYVVDNSLGNFTAKIMLKDDWTKVIGLDGTNMTEDNNIVLRNKKENDKSQIWSFVKNSDGTYCIINSLTGQYFDVHMGLNDNFQNVKAHKYNGDRAQKFYIMKYNNGYRIVPMFSGDLKAIDIAGNHRDDGTNIDIHESMLMDNVAQTWLFEVESNGVANVEYTTHVQNVGWQNYVKNGATAGTSGQSLRLEGIKIKVSSPYSGGIEYSTHVQNIGWQNFVSNDALSGTSGRSLRLEAIKIRLTGELANKYDVYYRVHAQNVGWLGWAKNGASSGTAGYGYRLEGIEIKLVEKGKPAPGTTLKPFKEKAKVEYTTHVQNEGWQNYVSNGAVSGTLGKGLRLEGIKIRVKSEYETNILYQTHIQNIGWQEVKEDDQMSGTSGRNLRLEAIRIALMTEVSNYYDIYYRVHVQNMGWLGWAKNGANAGTSGYGYRLEGIEIRLVEKGDPAPGSEANCFMVNTRANLSLDLESSFEDEEIEMTNEIYNNISNDIILSNEITNSAIQENEGITENSIIESDNIENEIENTISNDAIDNKVIEKDIVNDVTQNVIGDNDTLNEVQENIVTDNMLENAIELDNKTK